MTPHRIPIPITHDSADRLRIALELVGSIRVSTDDADNTKRLQLAVNAAKAALAGDGHDPLCEVLR